MYRPAILCANLILELQVAQAGRDAVLGMAAILVPADVPRLLAALDELACFPDEDVRQSVVIMLAGLTGLLSPRSCTDLLLPRVMKLLEDNAYLVRKVSNGCPLKCLMTRGHRRHTIWPE